MENFEKEVSDKFDNFLQSEDFALMSRESQGFDRARRMINRKHTYQKGKLSLWGMISALLEAGWIKGIKWKK